MKQCFTFALLALAVAGCMYQAPAPKPGPNPDPVPESSPVARAAASSFDAYRENLADTAAAMRTRIDGQKTYGDFFAAWEKENAVTRARSMQPYADAINAELFQRADDGSWNTDGPIDRAKLEKVLADAERGLRGK